MSDARHGAGTDAGSKAASAGGSGVVPKWFGPLLLLVAVGLILSVGSLLIVVLPQRAAERRGEFIGDALRPDPGLEQLVFPTYELVSHRGETVDHSMLEGGITILDFTFTHCPFACPGMNAEMLRMQSMLGDTGIEYVSITVDPERDTVERLAEHAEALGGYDRWTFLTGDRDQIVGMLRDELQFDLTVDESTPIELPGGGVMSNIIHPTRYFLIGPDRQVLSLASYQFPTQVDDMARRARAAWEQIADD